MATTVQHILLPTNHLCSEIDALQQREAALEAALSDTLYPDTSRTSTAAAAAAAATTAPPSPRQADGYVGEASGSTVLAAILANPRFHSIRHLLHWPRIEQPDASPASLPSAEAANYLITT
jgi:hypothetical protein